MTILENFLTKNKACSNGFEYAKDMTLTEFYNNCNRGDWIIWLFSKTNANDTKALVLVAAHCANACRHLLEDERSLKAIEAAMNSESYSEVQLYEIYDAAADAAYYAACAGAAAARTARALRDNKLIADIVRKHLPLEIWNQEIINN